MAVSTGTGARGEGRLAFVIALLALALHAPSLTWGFFADDYVHLAVLEGELDHPTMRPWSLFDFGEAAAPGSELYDAGAFPWWTDADWKGRFFRPVASLARWGEHAAFGRDAAAQHAVSLCLFAVVLALAWRLYRDVGLGGRGACLALALFAFEDGAAMPVGWLANQNTLLEAVGVLAALVVGRRAERAASARVVVALLAACLAAGSKESGVVAFGLLAWMWRERLPRASLAAVVCGGAYFAAWLAGGYGMRSLGYPTPWTDPLTWGSNALALVIGGSASMVSPFMLDLLPIEPARRLWVLAAVLPFALVIVLAVWRASRSLPGAGSWWALAVLALAPQAGTWPSDRLLFVPMLGVAPLVAHFVVTARAGSSRSLRVLATALVVAGLPLSALSLGARELMMRDVIAKARAAVVEIELPRDGAPRRVVLLQAQSGLVSLQPGAVWAAETGERATRFFAVQMGQRALSVRRVDERTLLLETDGPPFGDALFEQVFRTASGRLDRPPTRRTAAFEATPELVDGAFRRLRLAFDAPLGGSDVVLVGWRDGALRPIEPPRVGEVLELAAPTPLAPGMP
ncbi:MAG: hypothetical protein IT453_17130 [Planctomycetes bacterium]|nr:hypothetical protein [Planctomycetota bacterium]